MWNRIAAIMSIVITSSLLFIPIAVEARGGGRGGGGGGGRGGGGARGTGSTYRGGNTMNRTPTMSRASNRPVSPQVRQQPQNRSYASQAKTQQSRKAVQQRPSASNRTELRNQVNRYAQNKPVQNLDRQTLTQKGQEISNQRNSQSIQNRQLSESVSQRLQLSRPDSNHWFDRNFFDRHNIDVDYVGTGVNWWRPVAWSTLSGWGAWDWSTPYYYEGEYSYPLPSTESIYNYPYTTTQTQTKQTELTQGTQNSAIEDDEWLPLGVFAVAMNADSAVYTHRFIQLAINRSGEIAGVLYNSATDAAQDLIGMVDSTSQKAYWSMANRTGSPIASTGIYNLTEDKTTINVHFADGSDQIWTLVRLQQGQ